MTLLVLVVFTFSYSLDLICALVSLPVVKCVCLYC